MIQTNARSAATAPLLEMRNISKTFGSARALSNVSFSVEAGEVHALMGENGAGKSTLMKILSGAYDADPGGEILVDGSPIDAGSPQKSKAAGISVIYQELSLAPNLTVAQNMFLGAEHHRFGILDRSAARIAAAPILKKIGADFTADDIVSSLSLGQRQLVEIARTLTTNSRIIVMDEPTTSLTARETGRLFDIIGAFKEQGLAIVYISHRMEEIYRLSDRVSVLRDSAYVGTLARDEISAPKLVSMMVGRDLSSFYKKEHSAHEGLGNILLSVKNLGDGVRVHDCSFDLRAGEVLGISGLVGSGRTELARLIYGADKSVAGEILLGGRPLDIRSPADALAAGIVYLTEDRKRLGLFLDMSVSDNVNIGVIGEDSGLAGTLNFARARERADKAIKSLSIRTASTQLSVGALSGGNQQKVLLARLLESEPKIIILDEPTRGVDVGAKSEIYRMIDGLAKRGLGIVVISSDLPEIIGIADRALVMREGRIAGEVLASADKPLNQEEIMTLSTGAADAGAVARQSQGTMP
ncbi:MAG: sugar ABC transporter ATP-binding protein [Rhizobiaceae bacterium]|nr:sugar ABC transporter ATP-binding protein [Rhizobiaceae bacterium]